MPSGIASVVQAAEQTAHPTAVRAGGRVLPHIAVLKSVNSPFFAVLFTIALLKVKQLEIHKRLMLVATVSLLQAAVGRWFLIFLAPVSLGGGPVGPPPVFVTIMPGLVSDLLIVAAMIHDRKTIGRVHPVYWVAGGALVALQVLRVPLSKTAAWTQIANWLLTVSL